MEIYDVVFINEIILSEITWYHLFPLIWYGKYVWSLIDKFNS